MHSLAPPHHGVRELVFAPVTRHSGFPLQNDDCNPKRFEAVKLDRFIIWLVQPLLALLLIAASAQAEPYLFEDESRIQTFATVLNAVDVMSDRGDDTLPALQPASDRDDDDHGSSAGSALAPVDVEALVDPARLIEISFAAYPTAPPSHRPCAAPSTGPPLV